MFGRGRLGERRQTQDCTEFKPDLEVEGYDLVTTPVTQGDLNDFILFLFRMSTMPRRVRRTRSIGGA
jgi:hypothetical protein